ncbi:MAG: hypothetical protein WAK55_05630 [Xanthobacteraceae bacterium]
MIKTASAIVAAALVAACLVSFPSLSSRVDAHSSPPGTNGDRADVRPLGCGEKAWPYFDAACVRDARAPSPSRVTSGSSR